MFRLIVADAQAIVRAGLKQLLSSWTVRHELAEAGNAHDVWSLMSAGDWQMLLLDLKMPGAEGLGLLREMQARNCRPRVLVWGGIAEERFAVDAMRLGSFGYVSKQDPPHSLLNALEQVFDGKRYISSRLGELMAEQLTNPSVPHEMLSARERQVFDSLAAGKKTGQIARALGLTVGTVSTYRARICDKMQLASNADMALYAARYGLAAVSNIDVLTDTEGSVADRA